MKSGIRQNVLRHRSPPEEKLLIKRLGSFLSQDAEPGLAVIAITVDAEIVRLKRPNDIHKADTARSVICLSCAARPTLKANLRQVVDVILAPCGFFYLLLPSMVPPRFHAREDGPVNCFACCAQTFKTVLLSIGRQREAPSIFSFVRSALSHLEAVNELKVVQLGKADTELHRSRSLSTIQWIIPHRGSLERLSSCLFSVEMASPRRAKVSVGFDERMTEAHRALAKEFPGVDFFACKPSHAGPYVVRNLLAARTGAPILMFQDSDDISCSNRAQVLLTALQDGRYDMIGSHTVVLDEIGKKIYTVRFPLDVTRSLNQGPNHALLHPASAIRAEAFWHAGAFDCSMRHSLDTQFLLRSHFHFRSRNVNQFLYIKFIRPHSLTTSHTTGFYSFGRRRAWGQWANDFPLVKSGALMLSASSLAPQIVRTSHSLVSIDR
jgi:hypothetical protein